MSEKHIRVIVNGKERNDRVSARLLLTDYLRHTVGLHGTKVGCEQGVCGACTVQIDGMPARSCLTLAVQVDGHAVRTVEDLDNGINGLHPLQESFHRHYALQCGFCTPGFLMTAEAELENLAYASREEIRNLISGNICRCTGYEPIVNAIAETAAGDQNKRKVNGDE